MNTDEVLKQENASCFTKHKVIFAYIRVHPWLHFQYYLFQFCIVYDLSVFILIILYIPVNSILFSPRFSTKNVVSGIINSAPSAICAVR
jgi:hypothetical protein